MRRSADPRIVIALGGNALGNTPEEQERNIDHAVPALVDLITKGYEIIITHGNGPQVGMIQNAFAEGGKHSEKIPDVPLAECTAMSQGYIGFHLQKALRRELRARELPWHVASVVTQVAVDPTDPAFRHPTKPIGAYYTKEEAEKRSVHEKGAVYADDAGRGWRKVVPSPKPLRILEKESILHLLDHEFVVIACGGGGIPVVKTGFERYESV
ncbi:MAG: carbamate kinase, partial [Firmicutes bacterium]|nr:carbamate kinase [Bacillota bacterium]